MEKRHWELRKLLEAIEKEVSVKPAKIPALKKVTNFIHGKEKPKKETLDRLALFVGFQDWDSFRDALYGDANAATNYEEKENPSK